MVSTVRLPLIAAKDLSHRDLRVVVENPRRHAAEVYDKRDGPAMAKGTPSSAAFVLAGSFLRYQTNSNPFELIFEPKHALAGCPIIWQPVNPQSKNHLYSRHHTGPEVFM